MYFRDLAFLYDIIGGLVYRCFSVTAGFVLKPSYSLEFPFEHSKHFTYKVKLVRRPYLLLFMFPFIQIKSKINKKSRSHILTN